MPATATPTIAVMSPGDMGHSVGAVLHQHGLRVITCLEGRSQRTADLAAEAGIEPVPSIEELVRQADVLISILVPDRALGLAERVAAALRSTGADLLYADCNAISPGTVQAMAGVILDAGGRFADGGIIGGPPPNPGTTFYTSGPGAAEFMQLADFGLPLRLLDGPVGKASGLKMCYAAMTKGSQALAVELLVAAQALGVADELRSEQSRSLAPVLNWLLRALPSMPPKAYRWVGEMEEIARTFQEVGLTPSILEGAADIYRFVADTPIGHETPENRDRSRDGDGVIAALAESLARPAAAR